MFDAQYKSQIDGIFSTGAEISSLIDYLNCRFEKKGIDPINVGIGMAYGRILMIKAGYSGSGLNEVVWMGDAVNEASKLCSYGNKTLWDNEMMVSSNFRYNLKSKNQDLLSWNQNRSCYHGNVINVGMNDWMKENGCK